MNIHLRGFQILRAIALFFILSTIPAAMRAQESTPDGEPIINSFVLPHPSGQILFVATQTGVYTANLTTGGSMEADRIPSLEFKIAWAIVDRIADDVAYLEDLHAPGSTNIPAVGSALGNPSATDTILVITHLARVFKLVFDGQTLVASTELPTPVPVAPFESILDIGGDATYVLTSSFLYVSRDGGNSWLVDSSGLGSASPTANQLDPSQYLYGPTSNRIYRQQRESNPRSKNRAGLASIFPTGMAFDLLRYVYLSTSNGLYRQHPDSNSWSHITSFPSSYTTSIFVDRQGRFFASTSGGVRMSTDAGATWPRDSAGMGNQLINHFGDDAYGNIYAVSTNKMWRSTGGNTPWARIDQQITSLAFDPNPYVTIFNGVRGDSSVATSTIFGEFVSADFGATWSGANNGIKSVSMFGYATTASGRELMSTSLGIYYKDPGGGPWIHTFPSTGYLGGLPIYRDNSKNLYTVTRTYNPVNLSLEAKNWKSPDNGTTWAPDTNGISLVGRRDQVAYFVDETGAQHLTYLFPGVPFVKNPGMNWAPDGSGFAPTTNDEVTIFGSDYNAANSIYLATYNFITGQPKLWKRPTSGGSWALDTAGLHAIVYALTGDRTGAPVAGTLAGVYRRSGGIWSMMPSPSERGTNPGSSVFVVSVDSSGAIIAGFSDFLGFTTAWHGIYYTADTGATWHYMGLDSIPVKGLVSYGDTTYAFTYTNGVYKLTRNGPAGFLSTAAGSGWNMLSVPFIVADYNKTVLYPTATSPAYNYASGVYASQAVLQNTKGYWLKYPASTALSYTGVVIPQETVAVSKGWNMVGTPSTTVLRSTVVPVGTTIQPNMYGYTSGVGYYIEDTLKQGLGYWAKASANGQLILNGSFNVPKVPTRPDPLAGLSCIAITDAVGNKQNLYLGTYPPNEPGDFELPPVPLGGIFDARFASQRIAEFLGDEETKELPILVSAAEYPLTLSVELHGLRASVVMNKKDIPIPYSGKVEIPGGASRILLRIVKGEERPTRFALEQNYPNPFNPSTDVRYQIADARLVTLRIYDVLGREVVTLVNEVKQPGVYTAKWDATGFASGVYYYRVEAGQFIDTKKLILIR